VLGARSYRDPQNFVLESDGQWFRIAAPQSARALNILRESPVYTDLVAAGKLLAFDALGGAETAQLLEANQADLSRMRTQKATPTAFRVDTINEITYPWEWPNFMLREAASLTLELRLALLDIGLDLKDASAFNVQFRGINPVFMDLGSIELWRPNPSWGAVRQFTEHFINPLAVGSNDTLSSAEVWDLTRGRGLRSESARSIMPKWLRRKPALLVLQASTKPNTRNKPAEVNFNADAQANPELAMRATKSLTRKLQKHVDRLSPREHQTTWQTYGSREHYTSEQLDTKNAFAIDFVSRVSADGLILDIGGNDGFTSKAIIDSLGNPMIAMDPDAGALDMLQGIAGSDAQVLAKLLPVRADLINISLGSGLLGQEFTSLTDRIKPTGVICQAVLHHIVITQGVPMHLAVAALAQFGAPLHIELPLEEDQKVKLLLSQIPDWAGDYSLAALTDALSVFYTDVQVLGRTSEHRQIVEAHGLRS